jgi:hypothetical protein
LRYDNIKRKLANALTTTDDKGHQLCTFCEVGPAGLMSPPASPTTVPPPLQTKTTIIIKT